MNYYSKQINDKLDIFFDKKSERYADMKIFTEIFDFMDNSDFKEKEPEIFIAEVKRIRDLNNSFDTAKFEEQIKIAKNGLKEGLSIEIIIKSTGLTKEEINKLQNELL